MHIIAKRTFCLASLVALVVTFAACRQASVPSGDSLDQLILYSIDYHESDGDDAPAGEKFHKYPVLGKTEIKDAAKRKEIMTALKDGMVSSEIKTPICFHPRHGIRVVEKGKTTDFVICFECYQ